MTSSDNVVHNSPITSYYRTPIPVLSKDVTCGARQPKTKVTIEQSPEKPGVVVTWVFPTRHRLTCGRWNIRDSSLEESQAPMNVPYRPQLPQQRIVMYPDIIVS